MAESPIRIEHLLVFAGDEERQHYQSPERTEDERNKIRAELEDVYHSIPDPTDAELRQFIGDNTWRETERNPSARDLSRAQWKSFRKAEARERLAESKRQSSEPKPKTLGGTDEMWWGHFYISHLDQKDRNRIKRGEFEPEEIKKLAKGESPWDWHKPFPAGLQPPADAPPLEEWLQKVIEHFSPVAERIRQAEIDAAKSVPAQMREPPFDLSTFDPSTLNLSHLHPAERGRILRREFYPQEVTLLLDRKNPWTESGKPKPLPPQPPKHIESAATESSVDWTSTRKRKEPTDDDKTPIERYLELQKNAPPESAEELALRKREELVKREEDLQRRREFERRQESLRNWGKQMGFTPVDELPPKAESKSPSATNKTDQRKMRAFLEQVLREVTKHKGLYLLVFLLGGLPVGIATIWPTLTHDTVPEWLARNGLPKLGTIVIGWVCVAIVIAVVIIVRSWLRVRVSQLRGDKLEIARRLTSFMEEGQTLLTQEGNSAVWEAEVRTYIDNTLGNFDGLEWAKPYPMLAYPRHAIHRDRVDRTYTLLQRLGEIVTRLRD